MLTKELTANLRGYISEQTVSENVVQFFKHGNTFLLLELMNLRSEVISLREELSRQRENEASSLHR